MSEADFLKKTKDKIKKAELDNLIHSIHCLYVLSESLYSKQNQLSISEKRSFQITEQSGHEYTTYKNVINLYETVIDQFDSESVEIKKVHKYIFSYLKQEIEDSIVQYYFMQKKMNDDNLFIQKFFKMFLGYSAEIDKQVIKLIKDTLFSYGEDTQFLIDLDKNMIIEDKPNNHNYKYSKTWLMIDKDSYNSVSFYIPHSYKKIEQVIYCLKNNKDFPIAEILNKVKLDPTFSKLNNWDVLDYINSLSSEEKQIIELNFKDSNGLTGDIINHYDFFHNEIKKENFYRIPSGQQVFKSIKDIQTILNKDERGYFNLKQCIYHLKKHVPMSFPTSKEQEETLDTFYHVL